jgi:prepilin-type processing-associated H-X9-DG protein
MPASPAHHNRGDGIRPDGEISEQSSPSDFGNKRPLSPPKPAREPFLSTRGLKLAFLLIGGMILIDVISMLLALLLPSVEAAREAARRINCNNNLKQLGQAMLVYRDKHGSFPPAFVADRNGKPMHSWRALLLPYLERASESPGAQCNFDEPWDSPGNRQVTDVSLSCFYCPTHGDGGRPITNYMMVVGPHTISDGPHSRKPAEITDGAANTIMLVEVADSDVRWAEPKDLRFDQLDFKINSQAKPAIGSCHPGGASVVFCDGSVEFLSDTTLPERVKAMLTIDGAETTPVRNGPQ